MTITQAILTGLLVATVGQALAILLVVLTFKYVVQFLLGATANYDDGRGYFDDDDDDDYPEPDPEPDPDPDPAGAQTARRPVHVPARTAPERAENVDAESRAREAISAALSRIDEPTMEAALAAHRDPLPGHADSCACPPCFDRFVDRWLAAEVVRFTAGIETTS